MIRASHSSSSSGGRAFSAGNEPTTPALHCAITRSGTEMMNSGAPITGIDRRPLNKAGMDIGVKILWRSSLDECLREARPYKAIFPRQVLRFDAVADRRYRIFRTSRNSLRTRARTAPIRSGLISRSNEKISSHFSWVSSFRSTTTIWCSDLAGLVALARDLGALLVAEQRLQHRDDAERVQHHVAGVLVVGGDADDAVLAQAVDRALHGADREEQRERDHRLHHVELKLAGGGGQASPWCRARSRGSWSG